MWNYRKLDVWQKSFDLVEKVYTITDSFPESEIYGLTSQIRRAVVGISSNICEGCGRRTSKDFVGFLHNAMGSVKEVENQLMIAERLGYLDKDDLDTLLEELKSIGKMLVGLMRSVSEKNIK